MKSMHQNSWRKWAGLVLAFSGTIIQSAGGAEPAGLRRINPDAATGRSDAVVADASVSLVYTAQVLPVDEGGRLTGQGDAASQFGAVLANLDRALSEADSDLQRAVRLHVYVTRPEAISAVEQVLARRFPGEAKPAVAYVVSALPVQGALVAADAIAAGPGRRLSWHGSGEEVGGPSGAAASVMPPGVRIFIAGQAVTADTLAESTRLTLEGLGRTLDFLGVQRDQVLQVKHFLNPMEESEAAAQEVIRFFGGEAPPQAFVWWDRKNRNEVEMVVYGGQPAAGAPRIEYLTPTGMTASTRFSRVARVNQGDLVFTSSLDAGTGDAQAQVRTIFTKLEDVLRAAGSDFRHMAKATYYYVTDEARVALSDVRGELYDPQRPPAASAIKVEGVGHPSKEINLEMIAVTRP